MSVVRSMYVSLRNAAHAWCRLGQAKAKVLTQVCKKKTSWHTVELIKTNSCKIVKASKRNTIFLVFIWIFCMLLGWNTSCHHLSFLTCNLCECATLFLNYSHNEMHAVYN